MKKSQLERVKHKLRTDGYITRNEALKNYISRLGALIVILKEMGWEFEAKYIDKNGGKDFIYKVISYGNPQGKLL